MDLFASIFNKNIKDPLFYVMDHLADVSVAKEVFGDKEDYTEKFTTALKSSYKDFLFAVTNSLIDCKEGGVPYAICDIAKKVEYLLPVPKEPESIKRLEDYNKTLIKNYAKNTVLKKLQALDDYERSILEEVYEKYCMPEVYKQIVNDIVIDSGISKNSDNQQKLNAVADFMLEKHRNRESFKCSVPYADRVISETGLNMGVESFYRPGDYLEEKRLAYSSYKQHDINMFDQRGLNAISREIGITNENALRDVLINKYISSNLKALPGLVKDVIEGKFPDLSLKELKKILPDTKDMSNKEFCSFVRNITLTSDWYDDKDGFVNANMFYKANQLMLDSPYHNKENEVWKELDPSVSVYKTVADLVLDDGVKNVNRYFDFIKDRMKDEDIDYKLHDFKEFVVKEMSAETFRINYPELSSFMYGSDQSVPTEYASRISTMKNTAMDNVMSMYKEQGLQTYLENRDPWNSLHPTRLSTIVNNETYIAYERDETNTPTFYVFGTVDKKMLRNINEVIAHRLKTKGAPEGEEYHIVISDGKKEDTAYKANLGNPKSLTAMEPSERNRETRQWLQAVVKYKVDNGYEKYLSKPKPKGPEKVINQSGGRTF